MTFEIVLTEADWGDEFQDEEYLYSVTESGQINSQTFPQVHCEGVSGKQRRKRAL